MTDAERIERLEAKVAELEAERTALVTEFRTEIARLEADLDEHLRGCPGSSKVERRRAMKKQEAQPEGRAG